MQFFVFQKWIEAFFSNVCGTLILCFYGYTTNIEQKE